MPNYLVCNQIIPNHIHPNYQFGFTLYGYRFNVKQCKFFIINKSMTSLVN